MKSSVSLAWPVRNAPHPGYQSTLLPSTLTPTQWNPFSCNEFFLTFSDIPQNHGDLAISILVYSKQKSMQVSPSVSSLTSNSSRGSFFSLKRRGTLSSTLAMHAQHSPDYTSPRVIASGTEIGSFLDEITIIIPSTNVFSKIPSWHPLKSLGRVRVEMGMMMDVDYQKVSEVPIGMSVNLDYLNFYLLTPGGLVSHFFVN